MNATAARGLTAIKQKIKKVTRENEAVLGEYKQVRPECERDAAVKNVGVAACRLRRFVARFWGDSANNCAIGQGCLCEEV